MARLKCPAVDAGRITADGCEKIVRLLTLCDSFDLPVVSVVDSAGFARDDREFRKM